LVTTKILRSGKAESTFAGENTTWYPLRLGRTTWGGKTGNCSDFDYLESQRGQSNQSRSFATPKRRLIERPYIRVLLTVSHPDDRALFIEPAIVPDEDRVSRPVSILFEECVPAKVVVFRNCFEHGIAACQLRKVRHCDIVS
jgi:hypothetical protein